ncbi:MAG: hypothetical protein V2A56_02260 [bacterium]
MTPIDYLLVAVFLAFTFYVGMVGGKFVKHSDDYFVASRALPPFILAAAITATNVNLYSFIGQAGTASQHGISIIWQTWTGNMALVFSGLFILPVFRRLRIRSVPELLEHRYAGSVRGLVGVLWVFRLTFWIGVVLYASGVAAAKITGVDSVLLWLMTFGVITVLYTMIGGMWSVALNDILQFVLMLVAAMIVLPLAMSKVGWMPGLIDKLAGTGKLDLVPQVGQFNWKFILAIFFLGIEWAAVDQGLLQRAFGARSTKSVAKGLVIAGIVTTPFALLWILPGLAGSVIVPGVSDPDAVIPLLYRQLLPPVILGLVLCGLLSSQISTISGNLNAVATMLANDLYRRFFKRDATSTETLRVARFSTLGAGLLMVGISLLVERLGGVVNAYLTVIAIMDMPLFVIAVIYGFTNWADHRGAMTALLMGVAAGTVATFGFGFEFAGATLVSGVTALVGMPLGHVLFKGKADNKKVSDFNLARRGSINMESEADGLYSVIPASRAGRVTLLVFFAALAVFFVGVISGGMGQPWAPALTIGAMTVYFLAGLWRLRYA